MSESNGADKSDGRNRVVDVAGRHVICAGKREEIDKCRFCVHSVSFECDGVWVKSPARAYCSRCRSTDPVISIRSPRFCAMTVRARDLGVL
jgi:hypothetical protein